MPASEQITLPVGVTRKLVGGDEIVSQQGCHPLLATANPELLAVLLLGPEDRQPNLLEGFVEGDAVPIALGVREDTVAIEDQCRHRR